MNSFNIEHNQSKPKDYLAFGFPIFLMSESMIFVSFFVTYIIFRFKITNWFPAGVTGLDINRAAINTVILISSSLLIRYGQKSLEKNNLVLFRRLWLLSAAMGLVFLWLQGLEWQNMPFGIDAGIAGSTFYLFTGFHALHVLTGVILLLLMYWRSLQPHNYNLGHSGVNAVALFWYFLDAIWIILFLLLYIWQ